MIYLILFLLLIVALYFYLDTKTYWPNIKNLKDFNELFVLRTRQHFCKHNYILGKTCLYCTKCFHTKDYKGI